MLFTKKFLCYVALIVAILFLCRCKKDEDNKVPTVHTKKAWERTQTSAISGGNITDDGGTTITARGICWSTDQDPSINDSKTENSTGEENFTCIISGLEPNTKYYVKAYATNSAGTGYGDTISFITQATYVEDVDGNLYTTVIIGNQEWFARNLRTTRYNDGTPISWKTSIGAHFIYPHSHIDGLSSDAEVLETYGALYDWYAVETGNLCPTGWRVPTDTEWSELFEYIVKQGYPDDRYTLNSAANALKSCRQVSSPLGGDCATSEHPRWEHLWIPNIMHYGTDVYDFSALPGGYLTNFKFSTIGYWGWWWSSTESNINQAWFRRLAVDSGHVRRGYINKGSGSSVRCIR